MPTAWNQNNKFDNTKMNLSDKPKIAIIIPYNTSWDPEWVQKSYAPLTYIPVDWCVKLGFLCKIPSLPAARNTLINNALQTECDYVFFVDTDMIFETPTDPNMALCQLYQVINKDPNSKDGKIVSGLYRAKQTIGFNWAAWMQADEKGFLPIIQWSGNWLKVDAVGLGCCLIDTQIFKNIPKPWFKWDSQDDMSEDFYFCSLAKKYGYDTHVFTDVKLSHLGNIKVKPDGSVATPDM